MKINANAVGNYSPYNTKVNNVRPKQNIAGTNKASKTDLISNEEKKFFTKIYPENKHEIMDYHYYKPSGRMSGVSVGSLFDRRG